MEGSTGIGTPWASGPEPLSPLATNPIARQSPGQEQPMKQAKSGDTVKVHYTGTLSDGSQFDSSVGREPLEVTLGSGQVIPGFEGALEGMNEGDSKTVTIPADDAYGPRVDAAVQTIPRSAVPDHIDLQVGQKLQAMAEGGQPVMVTVVELTDDTVSLDANHPLAGEDLTFKLELVEVG